MWAALLFVAILALAFLLAVLDREHPLRLVRFATLHDESRRVLRGSRCRTSAGRQRRRTSFCQSGMS